MDALTEIRFLVNALDTLKAEAEGKSDTDHFSRDWNAGLAAGYGNVIRQLEKILDG